jgi:light-regulated signal transduction histidine kinase (bacteriophytochrome)
MEPQIGKKEIMCNQIQVRNLDYIQSFGVLLVIDKSFKILQVSENVEKWFGVGVNQLLNQKIDKIPINFILSDILTFLSVRDNREVNSWVNVNQEINSEVYIREEELYFILEYIFIPKDEIATNIQTMHSQIFGLSNKLPFFKNFSQVCQFFAEKIKNTLGFDKVLIYQFLADANGKVIAEAKKEGMENYLGFHFPKSDIPPQVRSLFLKNPLRYIHDSQQEAIPIIPSINPLTNKPLDLSFCLLKGVLPIHQQYVNNMHIRTSISHAIKVEGKLWGLISCHHTEPKYFSYKNSLILGHFAYLLSNECLLNNFREISLINEQLERLSEVIKKLTHEDLKIHEAFLEKNSMVLSLVNATGGALYFDGQLTLVGKTPSTQEIEHLLNWLSINNSETIFHTESLSTIIPEAKNYKEAASGIIAASLGSPNYLLWFRPEQLTSLCWGGNPHELDEPSNYLAEIKPRHSFRLWREEIVGCSNKWTPNELGIVEHFIKGITQSFLSLFYLKRMIAEANLLKIQIAADKASEGILILDQAGNVEWMNSRLIHLFGKNCLDEVLLPLVSLLDTHSQSILESVKRSIMLKEKISLEIILQDRCLLFALSPFKNFDSDEVKLIGIASDITEINMITKEIETKAEALQIANKLLKELNKKKDQFIRMAAHDLRHPISSILMAVSFIDNTQKNDDVKNFQKMINIITNQSTAMLDLLNDILNENLLQSGQFTINKQTVDIKNFVQEICDFHSLIAAKKNIQIELEENINQKLCNLDKIKIKQVIDNFLSNAIKFSPQNSTIKVVCLTTATDLKIEVHDQGPGIPIKNYDKIFEQAANIITKPRGEEAHSLGLSICKQIIRAHQGEIGVHSKADMDTVFYFNVKI